MSCDFNISSFRYDDKYPLSGDYNQVRQGFAGPPKNLTLFRYPCLQVYELEEQL